MTDETVAPKARRRAPSKAAANAALNAPVPGQLAMDVLAANEAAKLDEKVAAVVAEMDGKKPEIQEPNLVQQLVDTWQRVTGLRSGVNATICIGSDCVSGKVSDLLVSDNGPVGVSLRQVDLDDSSGETFLVYVPFAHITKIKTGAA